MKDNFIKRPSAHQRPARTVASPRLIVIGASGLIGSELFSLAQSSGHSVVGTYSENCLPGLAHFDLRHQRLSTVLPDLGPNDAVYLLSAYSNPSWIHEHIEEARELNVTASRRLADDVAAAGARLIFMSSVEVFDGRTGNYKENADPAPLNTYGQMKHELEQHIAKLPTPTCIVRTGWNVGWSVTHRCVVRLTYETLLAPNAKMATDNSFSIIDVRDTAQGLLRLADHPAVTKLHLASTSQLGRRELADLIISHSAQRDSMSYQPTSFSEIPYSEPRARLNHLNPTFASKSLGLTFRSVSEVVRAKVRLLDSANLHSP